MYPFVKYSIPYHCIDFIESLHMTKYYICYICFNSITVPNKMSFLHIFVCIYFEVKTQKRCNTIKFYIETSMDFCTDCSATDKARSFCILLKLWHFIEAIMKYETCYSIVHKQLPLTRNCALFLYTKKSFSFRVKKANAVYGKFVLQISI